MDWDLFKTALQVARLGTVSAAAQAMGVHHATIIRQIDKIEQDLGVKLFQRHARGYTPTEAAHDLLRVAGRTEERFTQLASRLRGASLTVEGELIVTSLSELSGAVTKALVAFQEVHPALEVRYVTDVRVLRLHFGEAHLAIRAGEPPDNPDYVVQRFLVQENAIYASQAYVAQHGKPARIEDLASHRLVLPDNAALARAPIYRWLLAQLPIDGFAFRASDTRVAHDAVVQGAGIGCLPVMYARVNENLVQLFEPREEWRSKLWLVTHVDLHRSPKVQAFLSFLKQQSRDWPGMHVAIA